MPGRGPDLEGDARLLALAVVVHGLRRGHVGRGARQGQVGLAVLLVGRREPLEDQHERQHKGDHGEEHAPHGRLRDGVEQGLAVEDGRVPELGQQVFAPHVTHAPHEIEPAEAGTVGDLGFRNVNICQNRSEIFVKFQKN